MEEAVRWAGSGSSPTTRTTPGKKSTRLKHVHYYTDEYGVRAADDSELVIRAGEWVWISLPNAHGPNLRKLYGEPAALKVAICISQLLFTEAVAL